MLRLLFRGMRVLLSMWSFLLTFNAFSLLVAMHDFWCVICVWVYSSAFIVSKTGVLAKFTV